MLCIPSLGAKNKNTNEYIHPRIANKIDKYICIECDKDLILCKGKIRNPYFRHKNESINPCNYYSSPTETQIHKEAKMLLKYLLDNKIPLSFIRNCECCKKEEIIKIPEITDKSSIKIEHRFEYNGLKIADVVYIDDENIKYIFEICNTNKTKNENRPEPWFEIDAMTLINIVDNNIFSVVIRCIRTTKCKKCIDSTINILNKKLEIFLFNKNKLKPKKRYLQSLVCNPDIGRHTFFEIPYENKDEFKKLGGEFDNFNKLWFMKNEVCQKNKKFILDYLGYEVLWHPKCNICWKLEKCIICSEGDIDIVNENNRHIKAKNILKKWFEDTKEKGGMKIGNISFTPNRQSGIFLDYPICENIVARHIIYDENDCLIGNSTYTFENSWMTNWDEIDGDWDEYVPTYEDCINKFNTKPLLFIDVVLSHKGSPCYGFEIYNKNKPQLCSSKIRILNKIGISDIYGIDIEWILNQSKNPSELVYELIN